VRQARAQQVAALEALAAARVSALGASALTNGKRNTGIRVTMDGHH
jgi:hypothetical protein